MTAEKCLLRLTDAEIKAGFTEGLSSYYKFLSLGERAELQCPLAWCSAKALGNVGRKASRITEAESCVGALAILEESGCDEPPEPSDPVEQSPDMPEAEDSADLTNPANPEAWKDEYQEYLNSTSDAPP